MANTERTHLDEHQHLVEQVQMLVDERNVLDTLYRWSNAFYQADWDGVLDCFTHDASFSMARKADEPPNLELSGARELQAWFIEHEERVPAGRATQVIAKPRIEVDGDTAEARCSFVVIHNIDGAPTLFSTGHWMDQLRRSDDGRWRIARRAGVGEMRLKSS